jgi:hypothetical protein
MKRAAKMRRYLLFKEIILEKLELLRDNASESSINRNEVREK